MPSDAPLTAEQVAEVRSLPLESWVRPRIEMVCDSHELLRTQLAAAEQRADALAVAAERWCAMVPGHGPFERDRTPYPSSASGEWGPCRCDGCNALAAHREATK